MSETEAKYDYKRIAELLPEVLAKQAAFEDALHDLENELDYELDDEVRTLETYSVEALIALVEKQKVLGDGAH